MNTFIPKVRLRRHQFPYWYTPELRHLSKCLHTSKKRFSKHPTPHLQQKINDLELNYRSKILQAKSSYETNFIHSFAGSHNARIYDYIHSLSKKSTIPSMVSLNNCTATSDTGKASCICALTFSDIEVFDALSSLDSTKSSGCDDIGPKLIKHCASALFVPLHRLFSISLSKQAIPNEWKCHSIVLIFESGDKNQVKNYRPLSLLCIISKVLEHLVYSKVSKFITDNNILCNHQFGFHQHHSTTQQLLVFLSNILDALNNCSKCDIIYLDFKKAFNSVPHQELLLKLWKIGVVGSLWRWFREYLSNRYQHVALTTAILQRSQ